MKPSDAKRLQRLFYSLPPESVRLRYHGTIKYISDAMAQKLAAVDYSRDMAIVGLVGPPTNPRIVAEGRTMYNPSNNMGEFDILVHSDYRQHGLGTFLANYLNRIAYSRGLSGVYAEVIQDNAATMALLHRAWPTARKTFRAGNYVYTVRFPPADVERPKDSIIVHSGRSGDFTYGDEHPFNPARSRTTLHLIREHGYLNEPWMRVEEPRLVPKERLVRVPRPGLRRRDRDRERRPPAPRPRALRDRHGRLPRLPRAVRLGPPLLLGHDHRRRLHHGGERERRLQPHGRLPPRRAARTPRASAT